MKKTGELLKKAREEKGLSLNEIGLSLKINNKILKAIEEGDENNLPAKTFLRGFVKSYATFLRLDVDDVLKTFQEEMGSTSPKPYIRPTGEEHKVSSSDEASTETPSETQATVTEIPRTEKFTPINESKKTRVIIISVVVAVLFGLIVFTKRMIDKYSKEAEVPTVEMEETIEGITPVVETPTPIETAPTESSEAPIPSSSPIANLTTINKPTPPATMPTPAVSPAPTSSASTPAPTPTPKPSPTPVATPSVTPTPTPKPTPIATPQASPTPTPTPVASATPTPAPSPSPSPTPTPTPADAKPKPVELIVEALDAVEIEYAAPSGKMQKIKLSADQVHTFKSKSGLKINFSNGGAVNLILNGREVGIPGDLGKPIKLSY